MYRRIELWDGWREVMPRHTALCLEDTNNHALAVEQTALRTAPATPPRRLLTPLSDVVPFIYYHLHSPP